MVGPLSHACCSIILLLYFLRSLKHNGTSFAKCIVRMIPFLPCLIKLLAYCTKLVAPPKSFHEKQEGKIYQKGKRKTVFTNSWCLPFNSFAPTTEKASSKVIYHPSSCLIQARMRCAYFPALAASEVYEARGIEKGESGMEGHREVVMRKGPWMAEEDEILMDYVKKYGPRDWSSIRSKGLLPRTGKSCRLRWVNKLKPDLKTGCKFSAEEERVVIDLQARFGNKWARIATYLPGRTDNDVKNFWSTRQKRLARILQTPTTVSCKSQKNNNGKHPAFLHHQVPTAFEGPVLNSLLMEEESSSVDHSCQTSSYMGNPEVIRMVALPDLVNPNLLNLEQNLPQLDFTQVDTKPYINPPQHFSFPQFPEPSLEDLHPLLPENQDLVVAGHGDANALDIFGNRDVAASVPDNDSHFSVELLSFGFENSINRNNLVNPDSFFDDFPTDVFDYIEPLPSSSEW